MPNPLAAAQAFVTAQLSDLPAATTHSNEHPVKRAEPLHVQYAWDGTPSDADNREDAVVRITVWGPRKNPSQVAEVAGKLRARFLAWSSADVYRVNRGTGRLTGIDRDTDLAFCSFTVSPVMRALTP